MCYGKELQPKLGFQETITEWRCERCVYILNSGKVGQDINCRFCHNLYGIMRMLKTGIWVHILCVKWIPEISFVPNTDMTEL